MKQRGIPACVSTPPAPEQQFKKYGDTHLAKYLPQLIDPHRRQIHGFFVDLQARAEKFSEDFWHVRSTGKCETKRPEIGKRVAYRPSRPKAYLSKSIAPVFHDVSSE